MYNFENTNVLYEFSSCVTFVDGHKSTFRKVESIQAQREKEGYLFTFLGTSDELIDGKEPEDWNPIILQFGRALCPYGLQVTEQGELTGVHDFETVKKHWFDQRREIIDYYNNYYIEKESNQYALALDSEEKFFSIIKKNMFPRLLFWQEGLASQEVEIRDFPSPARLAIFTFQKGKVEAGSLFYETSQVRDEGSGRLLSGKCTLRIRREADGLPGEISLWARVEEQDTGYFIKDITIRRL